MDGQQIASTGFQSAGAEAGFFGGLFDFSFSTFVTTRVMRVLYILAIVAVGISSLFFMFSGFSQGAGMGLVTMILSPIFAAISLILVRIYFELVLVIFRIAETLNEINAKTR